MSPEQDRKAKANRVIRDLELGRDAAQHEEREAKVTGWLLDNLWAYHAIAGALHDIASRKESHP